MLIFNELPTAFPWYDKLQKQNRYKGQGDQFCDYKLITPRDALLPFQFRRPSIDLGKVATWKIFDINTDALIYDLEASIIQIKTRTTSDGFDYFFYDGSQLNTEEPGGAMLPIDLTQGFYYSRITFEIGDPFFSEMFHVPGNSFVVGAATLPFLKFEWYNSTDLNPFYFGDKTAGVPYFRNIVYLDTFVHASEPEISEEGTKDGDDQLIPTFQKAFIKYRVTTLVPDFLKVSLVLMQLHDVKILTDGVRTGDIQNLSSNSSLEANGFYSTVDILFTQDLLIINKSCNEAIELITYGLTDLILNSAVQGAEVTTFTGLAPLRGWLNVWGSPTDDAGPYYKRGGPKTPASLNNGTLTNPNFTDNWYKIEAENIGGSLGFTNFVLKS